MFCFLFQSKIRFGVTMDGCQSWQLVHLLTFSLCYLLLTRKILFVVTLVISQQNKKNYNLKINLFKIQNMLKHLKGLIYSFIRYWINDYSLAIQKWLRFYRIILLIVILYHTYFIPRFKTSFNSKQSQHLTTRNDLTIQ
jgi:hypothetical protein